MSDGQVLGPDPEDVAPTVILVDPAPASVIATRTGCELTGGTVETQPGWTADGP